MAGSLVEGLIRLGVARPDLRPHIRPLLAHVASGGDLPDRVQQLLALLPKNAQGAAYRAVSVAGGGYMLEAPFAYGAERNSLAVLAKGIVRTHAGKLGLRAKDKGQGWFLVTDASIADAGAILKAKMAKLRKALLDADFKPFRRWEAMSVKGPQGHSEGDFVLGPEYGNDKLYVLQVENALYDRTKVQRVGRVLERLSPSLGVRYEHNGGSAFRITLAD